MNGEDDRDPAGPENHYLDDGDIPPPAVRPRRAKPPPNIITAGGVDMARGHASGIPIRERKGPEPPRDLPRVVIAVETDLRKIPTHRRLTAVAEGREKSAHATPVSTAAARPLGTDEAPGGPGGAPAQPPEAKRVPIGLRLSFAALLILLLVGVMRRANTSSPAPAPAATVEVARPLLPPPPVVSAPPDAPLPTAAPSALPPPRPERPAPDDSPPPARVATSAPRTARPRPVSSAPHAGFTPPFELPVEKNRDGDHP
jgi:hypothetical protein